jgi:serine/threonine-protein kinase
VPQVSGERPFDQLLDRLSGMPKAAPHVSPPMGVPIPMPASRSGPIGLGTPSALGRGPVPVSLDSLVGRTLNNRYIVKRKIGEGGFGAVFEGMQVATERPVALKVLHPQSVADPTVVARFRREAEACSKLRSPHTVIIYDFDQTEDGVLYLAMELVRGRSLQDIQRASGTIPVERCLRILSQVAEALGEAHDQGIVHRDMKPENIMVEERDGEDFVKVLDFGIAKIMSGDGGKAGPALTAIGQTVGTLEFMSPEQLRGKPLDGRSDIYGLGMVTYEMLTGELPFKKSKSTTEIIQFHLQTPPPPPSSLKPELEIAPAVDELVQKMCAKSRDDRHANTDELRRHIEDSLGAMDTGATRNEAKRVVVVIGAIMLVVGVLIYLLSR